MRKTIAAVLILLLVCGSAVADGFSQEYTYVKHRPEWGLKLGVALIGEAVTVTTVYGAVLLACSIGHAGLLEPEGIGYGVAGLVALVFLTPEGCTIGTTLVGRYYHENGSAAASYLGGLLGVAGAVGLFVVAANTISDSEAGGKALYAVGVTLPAVGATVGYNLSCSSTGGREFKGSRFAPPTLTLTRLSQPDGSRITGVSLRLFSFGL